MLEALAVKGRVDSSQGGCSGLSEIQHQKAGMQDTPGGRCPLVPASIGSSGPENDGITSGNSFGETA